MACVLLIGTDIFPRVRTRDPREQTREFLSYYKISFNGIVDNGFLIDDERIGV